MKRWNVDRVTIFFFIVVVSFLYDLAFYLGIRDTARFPHPFVYFRSLGDIEYLRGFPGMLRQVMFSLVAGGLLGWAIGFVILKSGWLSRVTIRFLRITMWFPFLVLFAAPNTFVLGIAATMLAALYHYLTARSFLEFSNGAAERYASGESTLQTLFFILIAQTWVRQWDWQIFPVTSDAMMAFTVCALILALVLLINWTFRRRFLAECTRLAILRNKELFFSKEGSFLGVALLTLIWLLLWELTCVAFLYETAGAFPAIQRVGELLFSHDARRNIFVSLVEISGGVVFGGLLALAVSTVMHRSEMIKCAIVKILPSTYLSPIALWLLVFFFLFRDDMNWSRTFFVGVGHKIMGVGLLTFLPLLQTSWAFRDAPLLRRCLFAIDDALPIAFIAMLFGELYGATAGLGFQMTVASATYQYQQGLGYFLITAILLAALSMILRLIVRLAGFQTDRIETS